MAIFSTLVVSPTSAPLRVLPLPRSAWATGYRGQRPEGGDDVIGLRLPAAADLEHARREAARIAYRVHPEDGDIDGRVQVYNERVMAIVVARGTCRADDTSLPYFPLGDGGVEGEGALADDVVPLALTVQAIEHLYEQIDRLMVEESPTAPAATDAETRALGRALVSGEAWRGVEAGEAARARRLLLYCMRIVGVEAVADDDARPAAAAAAAAAE